MSIQTVEINTPDSFAVVEIRQGPAGAGGGGSATWGVITGTLSDQTDLQSALDGKAPASGISPSAIAGTAVITTDPRLSDARPPTAHTHVVSDITPVSGQHLIGRHAGGSGDAQQVTVGNGLEFQGSGIRRSALTGDVTASAGSNSTTIASDAVSNTKLANMAQATIKGRASGAGTGDPQDLTATEARTAISAAATVHTHVSADITDATSAATQNTLVLRDGSGGASFGAVDVTTLTASGIATAGQVEFNGTDAGDSLTFNMVNYTYGTGAAAAHRTAIGSGATGDALFQALTPAAARDTLELGTSNDVSFGSITCTVTGTTSNAITLQQFTRLRWTGGAGQYIQGWSGRILMTTGSSNSALLETSTLKHTGTGGITTTGDFEALTIGTGFILQSPNGNRWRITVDDTGALTTTPL